MGVAQKIREDYTKSVIKQNTESSSFWRGKEKAGRHANHEEDCE